MKCTVPGCPGEMEARRIVHTFVRHGKLIVVEDLPAGFALSAAIRRWTWRY